MITFKRLTKAARDGSGRGMDNYRTSATYGVMVDGVKIATISSGKQYFMVKPDWDVNDLTGLRLSWQFSFAAAKQWAIDNIDAQWFS